MARLSSWLCGLWGCRIVGPDCQAALLEKNGLVEVLKEAFRRLNKIAGLKIKFHFIADTLPAPGTTGACAHACCPSHARTDVDTSLHLGSCTL